MKKQQTVGTSDGRFVYSSSKGRILNDRARLESSSQIKTTGTCVTFQFNQSILLL
jgi:hypothetical protein